MWSEVLQPGELKSVTLLDEPLVFFRDPTGRAVAVDDMCPHRLAPLRLGKLLPDGRLQCGYHGLQFDASGQCMHNPHGTGKIPRSQSRLRQPGCAPSLQAPERRAARHRQVRHDGGARARLDVGEVAAAVG